MHYAKIHTWQNLYMAYRKAAKGKRSRQAASQFEFKLEDNLLLLEEELAAQTYSPGPYTHFTIHEPKKRLISAAPFRDRVVHHALCQIIEPEFEKRFIAHSYANRVAYLSISTGSSCHLNPRHTSLPLPPTRIALCSLGRGREGTSTDSKSDQIERGQNVGQAV